MGADFRAKNSSALVRARLHGQIEVANFLVNAENNYPIRV
jgi:hypothetical protein